MIPSTQHIEKAVLDCVSKGPIETFLLIDQLKKHFPMKKDDLKCLTACGRQKKFDNRVIYIRTKLIREKKIEMDQNKRIYIKERN